MAPRSQRTWREIGIAFAKLWPAPPVRYRRRERIARVIMTGGFIMLLIWPMLRQLFDGVGAGSSLIRNSAFVVVVFSGPMLLVGGWIVHVWPRWRHGYRRRVVLAGALACERCLYDLTGLSSTGLCPECGQPYEHNALYRRWLAWDEGIRDRLARRSGELTGRRDPIPASRRDEV